MTDTLVISGSGNASEVPRVPVFAVPVKTPNPAWIAPDAPTPEGYDEGTPEFLTELVTYDMPIEVNPVIGLEYGERSAVNGVAANVWIIQAVIGEKAYTALKGELKKMSPQDATDALQAVTNKIVTAALGN